MIITRVESILMRAVCIQQPCYCFSQRKTENNDPLFNKPNKSFNQGQINPTADPEAKNK